jgi:hypothetical protein
MHREMEIMKKNPKQTIENLIIKQTVVFEKLEDSHEKMV